MSIPAISGFRNYSSASQVLSLLGFSVVTVLFHWHSGHYDRELGNFSRSGTGLFATVLSSADHLSALQEAVKYVDNADEYGEFADFVFFLSKSALSSLSSFARLC
jgi:hypothetical protein